MANPPVYVRLGVEGGQVMLLFTEDPEGSKPANVSQWVIDPAECLAIAEGMATAAFEADTTIKAIGPALKTSLVEQHRMKLTQRFAIMLSTMRDDKSLGNGRVAQALVDAALKEVF